MLNKLNKTEVVMSGLINKMKHGEDRGKQRIYSTSNYLQQDM